MSDLEVINDDVRQHISRASGEVEHLLHDHLQDAAVRFPDSRAVCGWLSSMREEFQQHLLEAAESWQPSESLESFCDGQSDEDSVYAGSVIF